MEAIAKTRHLKGSPRKARLVIDLIRGRNVSQALNILKFTDKRAADPIAKTLRSAIANATYLAEQQNIAIDPDDLFVKTCFVDMGAHKNRRRMRPAPQGRAFREQRHYCHITILVSSDVPVKEDTTFAKKTKPAATVKSSNSPESETKKNPVVSGEIKETKPSTPVEVTEAVSPTVEVPVTKTEAQNVETASPIISEKPEILAKNEITEEKTTAISTPATIETAKAEVPDVEAKAVPETEIADEAAKTETGKVEDVKLESVVETDVVEDENSEAAKIEAKADAKVSDAKNVQSQTPAERNETKKADNAQLNENDILELQ